VVDGVNIGWGYDYGLNNRPLTAAENAALASGITSGLVDEILHPDTVPVQNSAKLITSGGVWSWFGAALTTLKTTAKTVIGAINELFDNKLDKTEQAADSAKLGGKLPGEYQPAISATGNANLLLAPASAGGQPTAKAVNTLLAAPAAQTANTHLLVAPATQGAAPTLKPISDLYAKPPTGMPLTDLASAVQASIRSKYLWGGNVTQSTPSPYFSYSGLWDGAGYYLVSLGRYNTSLTPASQMELYFFAAHGGETVSKTNFYKICWQA